MGGGGRRQEAAPDSATRPALTSPSMDWQQAMLKSAADFSPSLISLGRSLRHAVSVAAAQVHIHTHATFSRCASCVSTAHARSVSACTVTHMRARHAGVRILCVVCRCRGVGHDGRTGQQGQRPVAARARRMACCPCWCVHPRFPARCRHEARRPDAAGTRPAPAADGAPLPHAQHWVPEPRPPHPHTRPHAAAVARACSA